MRCAVLNEGAECGVDGEAETERTNAPPEESGEEGRVLVPVDAAPAAEDEDARLLYRRRQ